MKGFKPLDIQTWNESAFRLIGEEWMLITAGTPGRWNTMTASWGGFGVLWARPVVYIFIRPQRFTREFVEAEKSFTLSFFGPEQKKALQLCGAKSGRDTDKAAATGLEPVKTPAGSVAFSQARVILECRKIHFQDLEPDNFLDPSINNNYAEKDFHRLYVGEIISAFRAE